MNKIKLFCFPYGGGSATIYFDWKKHLRQNIELCPVEFAARGSRLGEENYESIDDGVNDVFNIIKKELEVGAYSFFGHSLGAMISFELAHKIKSEGLPLPHHVFFSGRGAPHMPWHEKKKYYCLPEKEFREEVLKLGGIPKEILNEPEFAEMIFKLLREDYKIAETYSYAEKHVPLDCDITIISALNDEPSRKDIEAWMIHTRKNCDIFYFKGSHFFLRDEKEKIVNIINSKLSC